MEFFMPIQHFGFPTRRDICFAPPCHLYEANPLRFIPEFLQDKNVLVDTRKDGTKEFTINLDGFNPNEIDLKVEDGMLRLKAVHEDKDETGNVLATKRMEKAMSLPDDCDLKGVKSVLSKDGVLKITAPNKVKEGTEINIEAEFDKIDEEEVMTIEQEKEEAKSEENEAGKSKSKGNIEDKSEEIEVEETKSTEIEPEKPKSTEIEPEKSKSEEIEPETSKFVAKIAREKVELVSVPVSGYLPEDLTVSVTSFGDLEIRGEHEEEKSANGSTSTRSFSSRVSIPEDVDPDTVFSSLTKDGMLKVFAYKKA